jgi:hypothetical protein
MIIAQARSNPKASQVSNINYKLSTFEQITSQVEESTLKVVDQVQFGKFYPFHLISLVHVFFKKTYREFAWNRRYHKSPMLFPSCSI